MAHLWWHNEYNSVIQSIKRYGGVEKVWMISNKCKQQEFDTQSFAFSIVNCIKWNTWNNYWKICWPATINVILLVITLQLCWVLVKYAHSYGFPWIRIYDQTTHSKSILLTTDKGESASKQPIETRNFLSKQMEECRGKTLSSVCNRFRQIHIHYTQISNY